MISAPVRLSGLEMDVLTHGFTFKHALAKSYFIGEALCRTNENFIAADFTTIWTA